MRRSRLATRISILSVGIAVLTAVIAGAVAAGLIRSGGSSTARKTLAQLANVVTQGVVTPNGKNVVSLDRLASTLRGLNVRAVVVEPTGQVHPASRVVRAALRPSDTTALLAGRTVSAQREALGSTFLIEGRPFGRGAIVLLQRKADAVAQDERAVRSTIIALLVAGALAALIGLLVAWRLARPLRRTAAAAHSLAAGNRDVTLPADGPAEVVEVSEAVNHIAGALRHSEARQREFLLSVSHDLRTPLTAISGYAESLADGVVAEQDTSHVGAVVLGEAKRLERLVGDLLDLARLGADDFRVDLAEIELTALVGDAARVWASRCAASGIDFRLETDAVRVPVHTDATRLRQVLDGLFENALRVTPAGAPIVLACRSGFSGPIVEVRDGGPGLSDEDLPVAFQQGVLFERYQGVRQVGTGLGLAIVHGLVERLGAQIEAGHAAEGGARFTVTLPALRPSVSPGSPSS